MHAIYDQLFARAVADYWSAVSAAMTLEVGGEQRLRVGVRTGVAWAVDHPALAQLVFWRAVPDCGPGPHSFAGSVEQTEFTRNEFTAAVHAGDLAAGTDVDEATRMLTVLMSGLISQQLANEPGVSYAEGRFSSLTERAVDMFLAHYRDPK